MNRSGTKGGGVRLRQLRERAGLTQLQVAARLGVNRVAYTLLEKGDRKLSAEEMLALAALYGLTCEQLLDPRLEPEVSIAPARTAGAKKRAVRINVPSKNVAKLRQVLLYILNAVGARPHVGETVLYKFLYFIDFDYYERYEEQLIGATYIKNRFGPTPVEFRSVVEKMVEAGELLKVKSQYYRYPQTKYLPVVQPSLDLLTARELEVIDSVIFRLGGMNASQISEYSHGDVPWITTEDGKPIEYEKVYYRTVPYTVRRDGDDEE